MSLRVDFEIDPYRVKVRANSIYLVAFKSIFKALPWDIQISKQKGLDLFAAVDNVFLPSATNALTQQGINVLVSTIIVIVSVSAYYCLWLTDETWVGVYTLKDCYPVHEMYTKNSSVTTTTRFFDLEPGISDPEVFTPPSTCISALPERMTSDCWTFHS